MDKVKLWNTYILVFIGCCVNNSRSACSDESSERVTGVLGQNVSLSCTFERLCDHLFWRNESSQLYVAHIGNSQTSTVKSYVDVRGDTSVLNIRQSTVYDAGFYKCFCFVSGTPTGEDTCYDLHLICQSKVTVHGEVVIFNSSQPSSFTNVVNVTQKDKVIIECPANTHLQTNCMDILDQNPLQFTAISSHDNCQLSCISATTTSDELARKCSVSIRLQVTDKGKSAAIPSVLFTQGEINGVTILIFSFIALTGSIWI